MLDFVYEAFPARIVFGSGRIARIGAEADRLDAASILLVSTHSQKRAADRIEETLDGRVKARIDGAVMHVPRENADGAVAVARQKKRRLPDRHRRRVGDRACESRRAGNRTSHSRRTVYLCGVGDDGYLGNLRRRRQDDRPGRGRGAEDGYLRPRHDGGISRQAGRAQRCQCDGPFGGSAVCAEQESRPVHVRGSGHSRTRGGTACRLRRKR